MRGEFERVQVRIQTTDGKTSHPKKIRSFYNLPARHPIFVFGLTDKRRKRVHQAKGYENDRHGL
jgi:hypothetical protein